MLSSAYLESILEKYHEGPKSGLFTDGGASPNPGPGGWGFVYVENDQILEQGYGKEDPTTNNRMELKALIEGYKIIPADKEINVYSDSNLCVQSITKWAAGWERKAWKTTSGPVKNLELVKELYALYKAKPKAKLQWLKAHNAWRWNEYADALTWGRF